MNQPGFFKNDMKLDGCIVVEVKVCADLLRLSQKCCS